MNGEKTYKWRKAMTTHKATLVWDNGKRYATGVVKDTRKGHHKPLQLNGYYEIIRNNENQANNNGRATWD